MLSIFLFLDLNDDVVVTIAVVVVIGEAGVGVAVASVGVVIAGDSVGTGEKEGDLDFFAFYSEKEEREKERKDAYLSFLLYQIGPYREFQLTPRNQNSEGRAWYRRYGIYKSLGALSYPSKTKIIQNLQTERTFRFSPVMTL
ncbi:hypothetical protein RhiirA5_356082 [Rhizophagus irregularis]|uniref:Uncharacterized protein n=1 Tax=Rhizophagus irregularis TaxID=588596 RepID=A0A2N0PSX0_9GLOM|nr:hypothetical protein RhiirA5_356082 [Rhizophagus irregularis]